MRETTLKNAFDQTTFTRDGEPVHANTVLRLVLDVSFDAKDPNDADATPAKAIRYFGGDGADITGKEVIGFPQK